MFTAAFVATQHDPDARAYYQRKRSEGKRHNAAVICVARRRCNIILAMLKTQTPYQPPQPQPESTDGLVGSTVWVWVAAGLVCLGGPVGVGAR